MTKTTEHLVHGRETYMVDFGDAFVICVQFAYGIFTGLDYDDGFAEDDIPVPR